MNDEIRKMMDALFPETTKEEDARQLLEDFKSFREVMEELGKNINPSNTALSTKVSNINSALESFTFEDMMNLYDAGSKADKPQPDPKQEGEWGAKED